MIQTVLRILSLLVAAAAGLVLSTVIYARHEFTQAESIVALHTLQYARGEGLYQSLFHYPHTVVVYGPIFHSLLAPLTLLGVPVLLGGRLISMCAMAAIVWFSYLILRLHVRNTNAVWAGTLLVASTTNLLMWGTIAQVDTLGATFAIAAFYFYMRDRLLAAGVALVLAVFTKQVFIAAGAAIVLSLLVKNWRRGLTFAACVAAAGVAGLLLLNLITHGVYFSNAFVANEARIRWDKFAQQLQHFGLTAAGLLALAIPGLFRALRGPRNALYIYLFTSMAVFLLIAGNRGADVNYALEMTIVMALCAGWALGEFNFDTNKVWAPILQLAFLFHVGLNLALTARMGVDRFVLEPLRREEVRQLRPYLERGRVISVQMDPLLHTQGRMYVEPLDYTLLVNSGIVDGTGLLKDLEARQFSAVVLYHDIFQVRSLPEEIPSLPEQHLEAMRRHYKLAAHINGPFLDGDYVYVPN